MQSVTAAGAIVSPPSLSRDRDLMQSDRAGGAIASLSSPSEI